MFMVRPSMRWLILSVFLSACGGLAWDTHVAATPQVRDQMVASIVLTETTEDQVVARWGNPYQKVPIGGWVEYVYRSAMGDPSQFVIVTFEHGTTIAVRSTETEGCRADFAPRLPGYGYDTPDIVKPIGTCGSGWTGGNGPPNVIKDDYRPQPGALK